MLIGRRHQNASLLKETKKFGTEKVLIHIVRIIHRSHRLLKQDRPSKQNSFAHRFSGFQEATIIRYPTVVMSARKKLRLSPLA